MTDLRNEPNMPDMPVVSHDSDLAQQLADFAAIFQDLAFCIGACERAVAELDRPEAEQDGILLRSLWSAALIAYVRCFSTGKRFGITPQIFSSLDGEPLAVHEFYTALRNKHIAHSVNPFEQTRVGLILSSADPGNARVEGVATLTMSHLIADREGVRQLGVLARHAQNAVAHNAKDLQQRVLTEAQGLPATELCLRPRIRTTAAGPSDAAVVRN